MANEKRLIDANALLEKMQYRIPKNDAVAELINGCVEIARKQVLIAPTVDAVEVVHGRWKYYHKPNIAVCTNCSFERNLDDNFGKAISCPNCGAKMDGDSE